MIMSKQGQYLWIKQRLDKYNISTTFPLQTMPLLQSLLQRLDEQRQRTNNQSYESFKVSSNAVKEIELTNKLIPDALRLEILRMTQQNNQLHMEIITLKQELQSLRHCMDKLAIQKSDNKGETQRIIEFKNDILQDIKQELTLVKFKYNELMDFIHGNDSLEKMYLKRLLNHKKFQVNEKVSSKEAQGNKKTGSDRKSGSRDELNSRITFNAKNSSSRQKQSNQRINQAFQQTHHKKESLDRTVTYDQTSKLKEKLITREKEILRLQSLLTYSGPNLNKILTQFNHSMHKKKHSQINQRLEFLENENQQLIKDLKNAKNNAGRYEALRNEVDKSHQVIKDLKEQNANIKRSLKENNFDFQKDKKENHRSVIAMDHINAQMTLTKFNDDLKIEELKKKVNFYQKQFGILGKEEQNNVCKKLVKSKISQKKPKKKSVTEKKNIKQNQYEKKTYQQHIKLSEKDKDYKESKKKVIKNPKNKSKVTKQKEISKIPEQSEQESMQMQDEQPQKIDLVSKSENQVYNEQAKEHYEISHKKTQEKNEQHQQSQSEQSEDEQQKDDKTGGGTLADQYLETISELSAKCLQLKEELQAKNNAISGLQQIVNRLIQKQKQQQSHQSQQQEAQAIKDQATTNELIRLKRQVQQLSSLLNESEFQKQELRREFIEMQKLYKQLPSQEVQNTTQKIIINLKDKVKELQQIIQQKDNKIDDMREDNAQIQDKLLKSLDRIRRLNDEIEALAKEKEGLIKEFQLNSQRLDEAAQMLRLQREKHSTTVELNQLEKDEIIMLRKNLLNSQNKIIDLQRYIQMLENDQGQNQDNDDEEN